MHHHTLRDGPSSSMHGRLLATIQTPLRTRLARSLPLNIPSSNWYMAHLALFLEGLTAQSPHSQMITAFRTPPSPLSGQAEA
jgi:hypothetical protein